MRRSIVLLAFLAVCGGTVRPDWVGNWQTTATVPGSYWAMTLSGGPTQVSGNGTVYREAGTPTTFTIAGDLGGTPAGMLTFTYPDSSTESFTYSQPDNDHVTLTSSAQTLAFNRVQ
ncbi:MAG TPA: hypothetical protein VLW85_09795 [Myxococcales bacterium]|nr:hypothetical protein [Myxococcales bacterium]